MELEDIKATLKACDKLDWETLGLLNESIGPSDFEKEYLCDIKSGVIGSALPSGGSASAHGEFRDHLTSASIPSATTSTRKSARAAAKRLLGTLDELIDADVTRVVMDGAISTHKITAGTIGTGVGMGPTRVVMDSMSSDFVARENRKKAELNPEFGSW